jgi:nucleoid-associated protein YgaU
MGLIEFVKNAGEELFGGDDEPEVRNQARVREQTPEEIKRFNERRKAAKLVNLVEGLGFEVEDLSIKVVDDVATVSGKVGSQADREKIVLAVGNTSGIGRVDDSMEVGSSEPEATYYTVQSGDTLSKIAKEYYGNAMKYPEIFEANKPLLSDPDKIYPGQVLRLPPLEG